MDLSLIFSSFFSITTLILLLVNALGPKKYKKLYLIFICVSLGLTLGFIGSYLLMCKNISNLKNQINSQQKQQELSNQLKNKQETFLSVKRICNNIPPNMDKNALLHKMETEPNFCKDLCGRLVRLFGIRDEKILYIDQSLKEMIDEELQPLFIIENGRYDFKDNKKNELAEFCTKFKLKIKSIEKELIAESNTIK